LSVQNRILYNISSLFSKGISATKHNPYLMIFGWILLVL
jgi:hypothetical protein